MNNKTDGAILTLDAGGTNFVFSAIKQGVRIGAEVIRPASTNSQTECSECLIKGFEQLLEQLDEPAIAISFAFPGPADYQYGVIGDLPNFPGLNGDYPLKAILESHFDLPVFINNDGNLFAFGEALAGQLPSVNEQLRMSGSNKQFKNLIGITLGTGIGAGIVIDGVLLGGDNSCGVEIHNLPNLFHPNWNIEESVSTRAIQRVYAEQSEGQPFDLMPKDIYDIAKGNKAGDQKAALASFEEYGKALGIAIVNLVTLIDGLVVLGGGITAAWDLFSPAMFEGIKSPIENSKQLAIPKTTVWILNYQDKEQLKKFLKGERVAIDAGKKSITHDRMARTAVMLSENGASQSTSLGAYHFALSQLNKTS